MSYCRKLLQSAATLLAAGCLLGAALAQSPSTPAPKEKAVKDQGEFDIYNEVNKDFAANNFTKALTDLDTWKQKYPDSDYKDDRDVLYLQAYSSSNQPAKAVDLAATLLSRDLNATFPDPKNGPQEVVKILFNTAVAIQQIPTPTPDELATGEKAAHMLADFNHKPDGVSDTDWASVRAQLQTAAKAALVYIAMKPGEDALQKKDYAAAEAAFTKAIQQYPDSGQLAYKLGAALVGQQVTAPAKVPAGLYEIARSVALDPAKGGLDPTLRAQIDTYLKRIYTTYHGSEEGLEALKQQALLSPTPPAGFAILSQAQILDQQRKAFETDHPELALWLNIKGQLTDTNGEQYFLSQLKDTAVPKLKGVLVEARPACHPRELLVALPMPDAKPPYKSEIALKLDVPLAGKPEPGATLEWEGVPSAFVKEPFLLSMDAERAKVEGLKLTPCVAVPVHHAPDATKK